MSDNLKIVSIIVGFVLAFGSIAVTTGVSLNRIDNLETRYAELKVDGCEPTHKIITELSGINQKLANIEENVKRIETSGKEMHNTQQKQLERILDSLLK